MPRSKKPFTEQIQDWASTSRPSQPWDKVEPLHLDEIKIILRIMAFMWTTHPDATKANSLGLLEEALDVFSVPVDLNLKAISKPMPRRDVIDAARLIIEQYSASQPWLIKKTVFRQDPPSADDED